LLGEAGIADPADVAGVTPLRGGVITSTWLVSLANETTLVVKADDDAPDGMFAFEAAGLEALSQSVRTPVVMAVARRWLVLEAFDPYPPGPAAEFWAKAGRDIARLHGIAGTRFGWHSDGWLGRLTQRNAWSDDGHDFFASSRVLRYLAEPKVEEAFEPADRRALERLCDRLPELIPASPPVLTHGDLWRGNILLADGRPAYIDPAVCWMWAETDISMMYCTPQFGAPEAFFAAYNEVRPLEAGWQGRMPILHLREQLSVVAHFGPQPEIMAAIGRTLEPFRGL